MSLANPECFNSCAEEYEVYASFTRLHVLLKDEVEN
jgi:hypothetical protein